jgi:hypothetical protein
MVWYGMVIRKARVFASYYKGRPRVVFRSGLKGESDWIRMGLMCYDYEEGTWTNGILNARRSQVGKSEVYMPGNSLLLVLWTSRHNNHRLKMELDLQSLFGLHVYSMYPLAENPQPPPPHLGSYTKALLASQHRRLLFVTPWYQQIYYLFCNPQ